MAAGRREVAKVTEGTVQLAPDEAPVQTAPAPAVAPPLLVYGPPAMGGFGTISANRCQSRSPACWGVMTALAGDGPATVDPTSLALMTAIEQGPGGSKVVDLSFGWSQWADWAPASQVTLQGLLGGVPGPGVFLFYITMRAGNLDIRRPAAAPDLRYNCAGRDVRLGTVAPGDAARLALVEATQRRDYRANVTVQDVEAAMLPARKKTRFSAQDDMVIEFRRRVEPKETFESSIENAVAYMEKRYPAEWHLRGARAKLVDMAFAAWEKERPRFQGYNQPQRVWLLTFWQRRLLFVLATELPLKRRLFWIVGAPDCGKGTLAEFLFCFLAWHAAIFDNVPLVFPGCMEATYVLGKLRDFAMLYAEKSIQGKPPGIIVLDYPKNTDFTAELVSAIEKLTDVGQPLTHGKYKGAEPILHSHVVVCSNQEPPKGLLHREIWLLRVANLAAQPAWQYPGAAPGGNAAANAAVAASAAVALPEDQALAPIGAPVAPNYCSIM